MSLNVSEELEFPSNDGVQQLSFWGLKLISNGSNRPFLSLGHAQNFSVAFILGGCIYFALYCLIIHDSHPYVVVANIPTTYFLKMDASFPKTYGQLALVLTVFQLHFETFLWGGHLF